MKYFEPNLNVNEKCVIPAFYNCYCLNVTKIQNKSLIKLNDGKIDNSKKNVTFTYNCECFFYFLHSM